MKRYRPMQNFFSHHLPLTRKLCLSAFAGVALMLLFASSCRAQAHAATAVRRADLQVGGGFSAADSDSSQKYFRGGSLYATLDVSSHFGAEFMFHQVKTQFSDGVYERTYEIGPRYIRHYGRLDPFVKASYGRGVFNFPDDVANLAYNMFTGTAGVDIHVQRHVNVRAEYEIQRWLNFPPHGLQPSVVTLGAAYCF